MSNFPAYDSTEFQSYAKVFP
jgi:hypothetical protein